MDGIFFLILYTAINVLHASIDQRCDRQVSNRKLTPFWLMDAQLLDAVELKHELGAQRVKEVFGDKVMNRRLYVGSVEVGHDD
jgi:hypothetical protein